MQERRNNMIVILGHTAGGKTSLAARVAARLDGEVISADSRQVYRGMDLGTGKDYADYQVGERKVPYHLVDILDAGEAYNVYRFQQDFAKVFREIENRGTLPVMCGGTGLYIESVLREYRMLHVPPDPGLREQLKACSMEELQEMLVSMGPVHNTTDTESRKRLIRAIEIARYQQEHREVTPELPRLEPLVVGVRYDRDTRRARITRRLEQRLEEGMVEEVRRLMESGVSASTMEYYGLEYKYLARYIGGAISYQEMVASLNTAIHRFAKRQMTYFRGMERRGIPIRWLDGSLPPERKEEQVVNWFRAT